MRLLAAPDRPHLVALFGTGLVGSAIDRALCQQSGWAGATRPYAWDDERLRRDQLAVIVDAVLRRLQAAPGSARCDVVWAAGVSGFGSTTLQMQAEGGLVAEICRGTEAMAQRGPSLDVGFHLISSAGGLFEGQTQIDRATKAAPLRSYGFGKLEQERIVLAMEARIERTIYRPASVYGFRSGARRGLFATLIANALTNKPTLISGAGRTLRDYILARDVGQFVARRLNDQAGRDKTYLLASGKPTSMFEVIALIENLVQRPLYRRFEPLASNASNLSFVASALPEDLIPTPLAFGLAQLLIDIRAHVHRPAPQIH